MTYQPDHISSYDEAVVTLGIEVCNEAIEAGESLRRAIVLALIKVAHTVEQDMY